MSRPSDQVAGMGDHRAVALQEEEKGEQRETAWMTLPLKAVREQLGETSQDDKPIEATTPPDVPITAEIPLLVPPERSSSSGMRPSREPPSFERARVDADRAPAPLRWTVLALGTVTLLLLAALIIEQTSPGLFASLRNAAGKPRVPHAATKPSHKTSNSTPVSGGLVIDSLSPESGSPGSNITITGSGLFNSSGFVVATFNGRRTSTHCPTEQRCVAVVPPPPKGSTAVTVRIDAGSRTSNGLPFRYD
jgi:hypothetical protein